MVELTFGPVALVLFSIVVPCVNGLSYFVLVSPLHNKQDTATF